MRFLVLLHQSSILGIVILFPLGSSHLHLKYVLNLFIYFYFEWWQRPWTTIKIQYELEASGNKNALKTRVPNCDCRLALNSLSKEKMVAETYVFHLRRSYATFCTFPLPLWCFLHADCLYKLTSGHRVKVRTERLIIDMHFKKKYFWLFFDSPGLPYIWVC